MTNRIAFICSHIPKCRVFADVGCDHGYMTKYALDFNLCERAYLADISAKCLQKAETLLKDYIEEGRCFSVCTDGLQNFPEQPDCVLIAGMGGEEMLSVLSRGELPERFVLQPMKNAEKVRAFLLARGARILTDITFADGKFYDLIAGYGQGDDRYSDLEIKFGRDNLKTYPQAFMQKIAAERKKVLALLNGDSLSEESRKELKVKLNELDDIVYAASGI